MVRHYLFLFVILLYSIFTSVSNGYMSIKPYITATQEYDDNIFYNTNTEDQTSDVVTTFTYGADIRSRSERLDMTASANFDWNEFSENSELGGLDHDIGASVLSTLNEKLSVSIATEYSMDSRRDRYFEDSDIIDNLDQMITEQVMKRVTQTRTKSELSTDYELSEITTAGITYGFSQSDYDDPEFANDFSHEAGIELERNISAIIPGCSADIEVNYLRYESTLSEAESGERTERIVNSFAAIGGLTITPSENLELMVHLGGRFIDSKANTGISDENSNDIWGTIGALQCNYEREYTDCGLSITHDIRSISGSGEIVNTTAYIFRLNHQLTKTMRFGIGVRYYLNQSNDLVSSGEVDEYVIRIRPNIRYTFSNNIYLDGVYSYRTVMNELNNTEVERNLFMLSLSIQVP